MGDVRLSFDPAERATQTDAPPYFAPVEGGRCPTSRVCVEGRRWAARVRSIAADATVLADGTLATVGQTYSLDGDVDGLAARPGLRIR